MAVLRPFKAVRPVQSLAAKVAALPYDVMDTEEARAMVKGNPYSFLHVDRAEIDLEVGINPYSEAVYEKARQNLNAMMREGTLVQDQAANLYVYRQKLHSRVQTGLVGCVAIDDYLDNVIKKHEHTRPDKEQDRINHVDYCDANTGPIFLTYKSKNEIARIITEWTERTPLYDFVAEDGISHTVWCIDDAGSIDWLCQLFGSIPSLYIADGHHRAASAVKVGQLRRKQNPAFTGDEEFNFFLAVLFPDKDLNIMDYNRVVADLNGLSEGEFMRKAAERFEVSELGANQPHKPEARHTFGMYLAGRWYKLTARDEIFDPADSVARLDVSILQDNLLAPILGIEDPRTDKRIDFIGGIRGLDEVQRRVDSGMKVGFAMYPTSIEDLMDVADAGKVMPPKSTWFEPKLRSGLFIHNLS